MLAQARPLDRGAVVASLMALTALLGAGLAGAAPMDVRIKNAQFNPASVNVDAGDNVTFTNDDSFAHDVLFETGVGTGAPGSLAGGANWSRAFDSNGTYRFRCQLHSNNFQEGMVGAIVVGPPAPLAPPPRTPGFDPGLATLAVVIVAALSANASRRRTPPT